MKYDTLTKHVCFTVCILIAPVLDAANIAVNLKRQIHDVSPYLTGANTGIHTDYDGLRNNYPIAERLADLKTKLMRFPGGNELDTYHWEEPGVKVWKDAWETDPTSEYYASSADRYNPWYFDIDEYLSFCDEVGAEPILGVNIESGRRYNRMQDSIDETIRLMRYCAGNGYDVTYWYIDNEPFDISATNYAAYINQIVPVMRAEDPDIKIIANPRPLISSNSWYWANEIVPFLNMAGHNIDVLDVHWYWAWSSSDNSANWARFLSQNPLLSEHEGLQSFSYDQEIANFKEWCASNGLAHIEVAALEWNVGKSTATDWSPYKMSLVHAEMMMQFIRGGLFMANIWPKYNSPQTPNERGLFNPSDGYSVRPAYDVLKMYSDAMDGRVVSSYSDEAALPVVSVLSRDMTDLDVYVLNKKAASEVCTIQLNGLFFGTEAICHTAVNIDDDTAVQQTLPMDLVTPDQLQFSVPAFSFARIKVDLMTYSGWPAIDLDKDLLPDAWEYHNFTEGTNAVASADADHDGASNLDEFISGTDPTLPDSVFTLSLHPQSATQAVVEWNSVSGRVYQLYWTTNLQAEFQACSSNLVFPHHLYTNTCEPYLNSLFYRMEVELLSE